MPKVSKSSAPGLVLKDAPSNPAVKRWQNLNVGGVADPAGAPVDQAEFFDKVAAANFVEDFLAELDVPDENVERYRTIADSISVLVSVEMTNAGAANELATIVWEHDDTFASVVLHGNVVQFNVLRSTLPSDDWLACDTCGDPVTDKNSNGMCPACAAVDEEIDYEELEALDELTAARQALSYTAQMKYANSDRVMVRCALAENPDLFDEAFNVLRQDPVLSVRVSLAQSERSGERDRMHELAKDPHMDVRQQIAAHKTPMARQTQELLLSDGKASVRASLADRPDLTYFASHQLARDENHGVKVVLINNPKTSDRDVSYAAAHETGIARDAARDEQRRRANRQALG
jgi:uncharacterized Zn finger protein (UPF0148 family)